MEALKLFSRYAPNQTFLAILLGSLSGLLYAFLIPIVMRSLTMDEDYEVEGKLVEIFGFEVVNSHFAMLFMGCCLAILLCRTTAEVVLARLSLSIQFRLRKDLYRQVRNSPLAGIESVGEARLIQALSTDVSAIVMGAQLFPQLLTNSVTLVGMLSYLAYLNIDTFYFVLQVIVFGVVMYQIPVFFGNRYFVHAREHKNQLQEAFRGLIGGAKELKLSQDKQLGFENEVILKQETIVMGYEKKGITVYSIANNFGGLLCFFAIGGLSFIFLNYHNISNMQVLAAVMVLLYVTGPISTLLNFIPQLAMTKISLVKVQQLYEEIPDEQVSLETHPVGPWQSLIFKGVEYAYKSSNTREHGFAIGPLDLQINRGEVTFITGGNGSGKSTLAKVISQHYLPVNGGVYFDDTLVGDNNITSWRKEIGCIYSDYYLFDRPLGKDIDDNYRKEIERYLMAFDLQDKVSLEDGCFTTLKLSDGQRRRLALVVAIVEDKSLYLFDEWAADQDPQFKHIFYNQILPDLKSQGKAVVVISHDDRYFNLADNLIIMESGQRVSHSQATVGTQAAEAC